MDERWDEDIVDDPRTQAILDKFHEARIRIAHEQGFRPDEDYDYVAPHWETLRATPQEVYANYQTTIQAAWELKCLHAVDRLYDYPLEMVKLAVAFTIAQRDGYDAMLLWKLSQARYL